MNAAAAKKKRSPKRKAARKRRKDLVFGLGATGLSVARYLRRKQQDACFVDSRETPPGLEELGEIQPAADIILGEAPKKVLRGIGRIIVSPGVADDEPLLEAARSKDIAIVSDIELFVAEAAAPLVGVTGSNGKSTVTTLLALMCQASGIRGLAGANLGVPALDLLVEDKPDYYILELSSFQLQRTQNLPLAVAVLLNISPDHLDWHGDEDEYRAAKYRIFGEAEACVFNREDEDARNRVPEAADSMSFGPDAPADGEYGILEDDGVPFLARGEQMLLRTDDVALVGAHNRSNALAALAAGQLMGLGLNDMLQVLHEFPGLPHRMQFVARKSGADFINDSKATNVGAAIASVNAVDDYVVLVAGGQGKGGDFEHLAKSVHAKLRAAVLIGEDADALERAFAGLCPTHRATDMRDAVRAAAGLAEPGDTVLLAPACASFDQYENYQARGDDFRHAVAELGS